SGPFRLLHPPSHTRHTSSVIGFWSCPAHPALTRANVGSGDPGGSGSLERLNKGIIGGLAICWSLNLLRSSSSDNPFFHGFSLRGFPVKIDPGFRGQTNSGIPFD